MSVPRVSHSDVSANWSKEGIRWYLVGRSVDELAHINTVEFIILDVTVQ